MAHNLNIVNGKAAFYGLREPGWHKLGQVVEKPVTDAEALNLSGLDWNVDLMPLCRNDMEPITTHVATVRSDTQQTLGVVGNNYTPVQNRELFDWLRGLESVGNVTIETAGALGDGETVWVLGRCEGLHFDIKGDEHKGFMTLINGHGGNRRLCIMPTIIRIVCFNTLRAAESVGKRQNTLSTGYLLRHTTNIADAMKRIQEAYTRTAMAWKHTQELLTFLAEKPLTEEKIKRLFTEPFQIPKPVDEEKADEAPVDETKTESTRAAAIRMERESKLRTILASPTCTLPGTPVRVKDGDQNAADKARFESSCFGGRGDEIKEKAWELALELAET